VHLSFSTAHPVLSMRFLPLDWLVLIATLAVVIVYGIYRSRTGKNPEGYFLGNRQMPWWLVMLSIMGTQASAITFLTAPGQAYTDGMRFVQYYFGLPLAMIVLCISFVPLFHRLKVFTAYEFLESRFDVKTRTLTSFLFLLSRGFSTGISIFAPSLVLHSMLGWDLTVTNLFMGGLLIVYTVSGGAKAVAYTQQLQFLIIYAAMFIAAYYAVHSLPEGIGFTEALHIAGKSGKMNVITTGTTDNGFDWKDRYNIWSGLIGGFFLALSYFGTDQSQVGRYLTAKDTRESRMGLLMNGLLKIPLQFSILLIGCLVFAFYAFYKAPVFFNKAQEKLVLQSEYAPAYQKIVNEYDQLQEQKKGLVLELSSHLKKQKASNSDSLTLLLKSMEAKGQQLRTQAKTIISNANPGADTNDTNYVFLHFVSDTLPSGLVGLIIAILFLAAWGSIAAALNALASCTLMDFHRKFSKTSMSPIQEFRWGRIYTLVWGIVCIVVAQFAYGLGNSLIEAVNILGSWFYGTILGIFLVAFYFKKVKGTAVFYAAILAEAIVVVVYYQDLISFLWLNVIGAVAVILFSGLLQSVFNRYKKMRSN
jgi:SSS family transporter